MRVGDVIGGAYRLDATLGAGGMGVVFSATRLESGELVAVKVVRHDREEATGRLLREARAVSSLATAHVARVREVGVLPDGAPYLVMDLLEGRTLAEVVRERGPLSVDEASRWMAQACDALADAHAHGIVHRDVKPSNLFVARAADGTGETLKVIDFGIARERAALGAEAVTTETKTGALLGSPPFMSPEQIREAKDVDARTDIWSAGVVLYYLVSGRLPFSADSLLDLMTLIAYEEPAPLEGPAGPVPRGFAAVVARCLAKRREDRFADAKALAEALAPFTVPGADPPVPSGMAPMGAEPRSPAIERWPTAPTLDVGTSPFDAPTVAASAGGGAPGDRSRPAEGSASFPTASLASGGSVPPSPRRSRLASIGGGLVLVGALAAVIGARALRTSPSVAATTAPAPEPTTAAPSSEPTAAREADASAAPTEVGTASAATSTTPPVHDASSAAGHRTRAHAPPHRPASSGSVKASAGVGGSSLPQGLPATPD